MITKIMFLRISGFWTFRNEEEPLHFDVHVWDLNTEVSNHLEYLKKSGVLITFGLLFVPPYPYLF